MPSVLLDRFRGELKRQKHVYTEAQVDVGYSTGFLPFDFKNGKRIICEDQYDREIANYNSIGLVGGSINFILGKSGLAKTTWALQAAAFIVAPFEQSYLTYEDVEGGTHFERMRDLTGWSNSRIREKVLHYNVGITAESFYNRTMTHCTEKIKGAKELPELFTYNTGLIDPFGNPIIRMIPTVIVLDSLALLMPEKYYGETDLSSQTSSMAAAKANTSIFTRLNQFLKASNTTLLCVNHISGDIAMDAFSKPQAQFNYLGQGKKMPGGDRPGYLANNILEFRNGGQLKAKDDYGLDGLLVDIKFIKSRTNKAGQSVKLVFSQKTGFSPILSLHQMLAEHKLIGSAGSKGSFILGCPEITFTKKNFLDKYNDNPKLRLAVKDLALPVLNNYVGDTNYTPDEVDDDVLMEYIPGFSAA